MAADQPGAERFVEDQGEVPAQGAVERVGVTLGPRVEQARGAVRARGRPARRGVRPSGPVRRGAERDHGAGPDRGAGRDGGAGRYGSEGDGSGRDQRRARPGRWARGGRRRGAVAGKAVWTQHRGPPPRVCAPDPRAVVPSGPPPAPHRSSRTPGRVNRVRRNGLSAGGARVRRSSPPGRPLSRRPPPFSAGLRDAVRRQRAGPRTFRCPLPAENATRAPSGPRRRLLDSSPRPWSTAKSDAGRTSRG